MEKKLNFSDVLLSWNKTDNDREMPWKGEKNPYKIWISEIILQQTRVEYGLLYYTNFISKFPDVKSLATADEKEVFKSWEGLGYYSRCRNLLASAKIIQEELGGKFPDTYEGILALKGVGPYTASAIASFAYNLPHAVLDGNVFRVLSRYLGVDLPIDSTAGKKFFSEKANELLAGHSPSDFNQAIMDFGATVCKPFQPLCLNCPLQADCIAYSTNKVDLLPVKEKKLTKRKRFFTYLVVKYKEKYYIRQRVEKDIWQDLHEFILLETKSVLNKKGLLLSEEFTSLFQNISFEIENMSEVSKQTLSHQVIAGRFFHIEIKKPLKSETGYQLVTFKQLQNLAFPKFITAHLKD